jgi:predicted enzyme related to lactoylglutathione lyase
VTEHRDPLDALREAIMPVEPDAAFAARLRARLELAVLLANGDNDMTTQETHPVTVPENAAHEGDVVYASLWLPDVARGEAFYANVTGWPIEGAEPSIGMSGDQAEPTLFLCHRVADVRAAAAKVRELGGEAEEEPTERPFGLLVDCTDNQGMRFALLEAPHWARRPVPPPGHGSLLYLTVGVPDSQAYRDFYGALFGWTFTPGRINDGWGVTGVSPMTGMHGGADRPWVSPMFAVRDINAAVAAVRAGGGTATDPERQPYGTTSDCVDDQGLGFYLGQL